MNLIELEDELMINLDSLHLNNLLEKETMKTRENRISNIKKCTDWTSAIHLKPKYGLKQEYSSKIFRNRQQEKAYPFETKELLSSLQNTSNGITKWKKKIEGTKIAKCVRVLNFHDLSEDRVHLRPSKLSALTRSSSFVKRRSRSIPSKYSFGSILESIPEEELDSSKSIHPPILESFLQENSIKDLSPENLQLPNQSCSQQATNSSELNLNELASYLDLYLHIPKKMSPMAEMMYT